MAVFPWDAAAEGLSFEPPPESLKERDAIPAMMTFSDFLVLQNAGPIGGPGMPEAGYLPIPKKLSGVKDMVRISDARMSGTAFGTVVLHVSPEAAVGGPLGLARTGDGIELSVEKKALNLLVDAAELERRRKERPPSPQLPGRGYERLYAERVQQAHLGVDFDFLRHESMRPPGRP